MTNTLKLKAVILERGFTQEQIAQTLGMTIATFNYKVNNKREFKAVVRSVFQSKVCCIH